MSSNRCKRKQKSRSRLSVIVVLLVHHTQDDMEVRHFWIQQVRAARNADVLTFLDASQRILPAHWKIIGSLFHFASCILADVVSKRAERPSNYLGIEHHEYCKN